LRRVKYVTAFLVGVVALMLELIGITFVKASKRVYRLGDWTTLDEKETNVD
jgi:hypothetical protein